MFICDNCENKIESGRNILKGFDCTFCSKNCREVIKNVNREHDEKLTNCRLWFKSKPDKQIIENTIKRTQSILDLKSNITKINTNTTKNSSISFIYMFKICTSLNFSITTFRILISTTLLYLNKF
jgi:hypothetical protein